MPDPRHSPEVRWLEERNWFFRLSSFAEPLLELYTERPPDFAVPRMRYNEARSFIEAGLDDLSITRTHPRMGHPAPVEAGAVVYVWFDALLIDTLALSFAPSAKTSRALWPADRHLMGKEIDSFHAASGLRS